MSKSAQSIKTLPLDFYARDTVAVARELIGKQFFHLKDNHLTSGIIIETEAYLGIDDPACHTYKGRCTPRVQSMYKSGGYSYVYQIYGLHYCFNVVTRTEKEPEAVLIRALFPIDGLEIMRQRRQFSPMKSIDHLCSGPGKLCQAMGIDKSSDGQLLSGPQLWISENSSTQKFSEVVQEAPRIGIDYAGEAKDWPLRFFVSSPTL